MSPGRDPELGPVTVSPPMILLMYKVRQTYELQIWIWPRSGFEKFVIGSVTAAFQQTGFFKCVRSVTKYIENTNYLLCVNKFNFCISDIL